MAVYKTHHSKRGNDDGRFITGLDPEHIQATKYDHSHIQPIKTKSAHEKRLHISHLSPIRAPGVIAIFPS